MAQLSRKQLTEQLNAALALSRKQAGDLATANTFIESLQEAVSNQGVSPEEITLVESLVAAIQENEKRIAELLLQTRVPVVPLVVPKA
jgi:phosphate uptake regulator